MHRDMRPMNGERSTVRHRTCNSFIIMCVLGILCTFGVTTWLLSSRLYGLEKNDENIAIIDYSGLKSYGDLRVIKIQNLFPHHISLHYDDSEAGAFLTIIGSQEFSKVKVSTGFTLYATSENSGDRLASIVVRDGQDTYYLHPLTRLPRPRNDQVKYQLDHRNHSRPHPQVRVMHQKTSAMAAKFKSLSSRKLDMWFEDGAGGLLEGHLKSGQETTTNTYDGHVFFFTVSSNRSEEVARFLMYHEQVSYTIRDLAFPAIQALLDMAVREEDFTKEYRNRTGIHWQHYFGPQGPRPPPSLFMWPASYVGQAHTVTSPEGFWTCDGAPLYCQSKQPVVMELEVVSLRPRAFLVDRFLSDYETDQIIKLARPGMAESHVGEASVGIQTSETRTSLNSWLRRKTNRITETLFLRASDLLAVENHKLTREENAEDMQVVRYVNGQKYDSHHDWGVSGYPESRYITLLLYLTDPASTTAGGETSFPKGHGGQGFKVVPKKGSAVLFYNLLPDGNGDDLALHAALPCIEGEKWLANFWVWDEKYKST